MRGERFRRALIYTDEDEEEESRLDDRQAPAATRDFRSRRKQGVKVVSVLAFFFSLENGELDY